MSKVKPTNLKNLALRISYQITILTLTSLSKINHYLRQDHHKVAVHEKKCMHLNIIRIKFIKITHPEK